MDLPSVGLFLIAAFLGGLTTGLSGFAMGLVVSGIWLHLITPTQNALLIVLCGIVTKESASGASGTRLSGMRSSRSLRAARSALESELSC
jgi:uncharacterized membrane protein YfcA